MKKLRKMLGNVESQEVKEMMQVIDSQDLKTISMWALDVVREIPGLESLKQICADVINEKEEKVHLKIAIKKENDKLKDLNFLDEIASRTIIAATGVYLTPTKALDYIFYYASYRAYYDLGFEDTKAHYDAYASQIIKNLLVRLKEVSKEKVEKPLNLKWNC